VPVGGVTHNLTTLDAHATAGGVMTLALWVFMGTEFVTPLIPEALRPNRDLPWAMFGGLFALATADILYAVGGSALMPRSTLLSSGTPHLDYAVAVFGAGARAIFVVLAILATTSVMNTVIASLSRMLVGMAENGQAFPILKWTHPRLRTPVVAIIFVASLPLVGLFWSRGDANAILPLSIAASVSWLLAYMIAQVSVVVLRYRYPDAHRPFRAPWYPVVPLFAFVGMAYAILNSSPEPGLTDSVLKCTAVVLGLFAIIGSVWVKFVMKKGLFEPVPVGDLRAGAPSLNPALTDT
jgi:amino acid transporter